MARTELDSLWPVRLYRDLATDGDALTAPPAQTETDNMPHPSPLNRRRFLGATATTIGSFLLPDATRLIAAPSGVASTEQFWYYLAPEEPYIDSQRGNKAFGFGNGKVFLSEDMGKTWAQYDLSEFGPRSGCRFHKKNSDGWFRVELRKGWIERGEVLFIKPKS